MAVRNRETLIVAAVGIIPNLIIGLREGVEAALVIGIIVGYLAKMDRSHLKRYVYEGTGAAIATSACVAAVLFALTIEWEGFGEQVFEGGAMLVAVAVLTSMVLWMIRASRNIKAHVQERIDAVLSERHVLGLAVLSFVVVLREGIETALFVFSAGALTSPTEAVVGVAIGLVVAAFLGVGIIRVSWRINLKRFFQITGVFLVMIAAGLFAHAVHELQAAFAWSFGNGTLYDLTVVFPDDASNVVGYLLRGIIGYNAAPTVLEGAAYVGYWIVVVLVYLAIRGGRITALSEPLHRVWNSIVRRRVPAGGDAE